VSGESDPSAFEPELAESWEAGEDGRSLTFRLREAQWSDGTPITATDVRFTWQAQIAPEIAWIGATAKSRIRDVEVIDDRTVRFHYDGPYPHQLADAAEGGIVPAHIFSAVPFADWRTHDWLASGVGSGPFLVERHEPGHEIVLVRNPRHFRQDVPRLDRLVIRIVPDATNLLTQVLAGEVDYFEGLSPRDAERLASSADLSLVGFDYPKYDYIGWNGARAPLHDPRLRRALTMAIDREALVEELLHGYGRVSRGPVPSFVRGADPDLEPWPYDPDEARRVLAELGYATAEGEAGRRLEIELITNAGNRLREAMSVKIQEQLARVGVRVRLQTLEMGALVARCSTGDYDAYLGGWTVLGRTDLRPAFGSRSVPPGGSNVVAFHSEEVDRLLDGVDRAADWRSMEPLLHRIQRQIHEEQPYTFLYETQRIAVVGPRLLGIRIDDPADPLRSLERCWLDRT
jgi:peptide/nickel transport system substrate-binding protein